MHWQDDSSVKASLSTFSNIFFMKNSSLSMTGSDLGEFGGAAASAEMSAEMGHETSHETGLVRQWLAAAQHVAVLTGAGISAQSGVPTFRDDKTGYWAQFKPEDMASKAGFRRDPAHVWAWYQHRRELIAQVQPNAGHKALAQWAQQHPGRMTLITQNVDGLHERAGSCGVLNLHGQLMQNKWLERACDRCGDPQQAPQRLTGAPPCCPACGNMLRPAVVWFGENLPMNLWNQADQAASACDVMLVVGTSGAVYPAAGLAKIARRHGAKVVIVNPHASELDQLAHVLLQGSAASVLPLLLQA